MSAASTREEAKAPGKKDILDLIDINLSMTEKKILAKKQREDNCDETVMLYDMFYRFFKNR